jgi:hypothetical protein
VYYFLAKLLVDGITQIGWETVQAETERGNNLSGERHTSTVRCSLWIKTFSAQNVLGKWSSLFTSMQIGFEGECRFLNAESKWLWKAGFCSTTPKSFGLETFVSRREIALIRWTKSFNFGFI